MTGKGTKVCINILLQTFYIDEFNFQDVMKDITLFEFIQCLNDEATNKKYQYRHLQNVIHVKKP